MRAPSRDRIASLSITTQKSKTRKKTRYKITPFRSSSRSQLPPTSIPQINLPSPLQVQYIQYPMCYPTQNSYSQHFNRYNTSFLTCLLTLSPKKKKTPQKRKRKERGRERRTAISLNSRANPHPNPHFDV